MSRQRLARHQLRLLQRQARRHGARLPRPLALVRAGRGRDRRRDLGPAHPPLDAETGVACCTFGVGNGHMVGSRWLVFLFAFALLPFAPLSPTAAPAHADPPVFDGKEVKDLCTISVSGRSCPVLPPPAELLNPGAVAAAGPEGAAALRRLEGLSQATAPAGVRPGRLPPHRRHGDALASRSAGLLAPFFRSRCNARPSPRQVTDARGSCSPPPSRQRSRVLSSRRPRFWSPSGPGPS